MGVDEPAAALRERRRSGSAAPRLRPLSLPLWILAAAAGADLLGAPTGLPVLWRVGAHLAVAGVAVGALAAGVRLAALSRAGRGRALRVGALAGLGLALFALTAWVRGDAAIPPDPAVLLAEPLAVVLLWMARRTDRPGKPSADGEAP